MTEETLVQTAEGAVPVSEFYGVTEIAPPVPNVTTASGLSVAEQAGYEAIPDAAPSPAIAAGYEAIPDPAEEYTVEDPLDLWNDETLKKDKSFDPVVYFNEWGRGAMDTIKLDRLASIFNAKVQEGVSGGGIAGAAGRTVKGVVTGIPGLIKGAAEVVDRAVIRPVVGMAAGAVSEVLPGADERRKVIQTWIDSGFSELAGGWEAEAVGFAEGLNTFANKTKLAAKRGEKLSDIEAKQLLIDWASRADMVQEAQAGRGATFNAAEMAKRAGVEIDPEAIPAIAAGGTLSLVPFGAGFKLVTSAGKTVLSAASRTAAMTAVKRLRQAASAENVAAATLKAGPATLEREAALSSAISGRQAAEATVRTTPGVATVDALGRAVTATLEKGPTQVVGLATQAAGLGTQAVAATANLGAKALRVMNPLGFGVGSILGGVTKTLVADPLKAAGTGLRSAGAAIRAEAPGVAARRAQDIINATADVAKSTAAGAAIDYGFAVGMSKSDEEAREMPGIAGGLGLLHGGARGVRRVVRNELVTPRAVPVKQRVSSAAYGENAALDAAHQSAMSTSSPEMQNQVNFVRETAKKLGGRVYVMPDSAQFKVLLDDIWQKQNQGAELPPEVSQAHKTASEQNGMFSASISGPDGKPQNIAFVRDPAALAHEGIGHVLERVLPEDVNVAMDAQVIKSISPENWEKSGEYYVDRLLGSEARAADTRGWREILQEAIKADPETYLARELRAENLDVAFRNRGEAFATSPDLYRRIVQWTAQLGEIAGIPIDAVSAELEFPVSVRAMARGEKEARKIIESEPQQTLFRAQEARLRKPAKPGVEVTAAAKPKPAATPETVAKAKEWVDKNPTGIPERDAAVQAMADAVSSGQGVTVLYWGAKGEPAGSIASVRPERRAQIEKQRSAENKDRALVNKVIFPYAVKMTSKGPQFTGWSPPNFAANTAKFESWLGAAEKAKPGTASNVPYEFNPASGVFSTAGKAALEADLQTFISNQRAGATGAGEVLTVPPEVIARGFTQPEKTGTAVPLEQSKADLINYLFNIQIPESVSRIAPLHLAGQEISAATAPGRTEVPVRPRGQYASEKLAKAGIPSPREVLEVNPFRQWVEQTSVDTKTARPSLIEVSQRLNVPRIEESAPVSASTPAFGGANVLTLASGFQPREVIRSLTELSSENWKTTLSSHKGKYGSGLTSFAIDLGASLKDMADVMALREAAIQLSEVARSISIAEENGFERKMDLGGRAQAAREAYEAATGLNLEGKPAGTVAFIKQYFDKNYEPPMPPK